MTTTNAERCRRYKQRKRGEVVPELPRGAPKRRVVVEDVLPVPPKRARKLQRVTRWNVLTGRVEERWE